MLAKLNLFFCVAITTALLCAGCNSLVKPEGISDHVANATPPRLEENSLFRPVFYTQSGQIQAGTAFSVRTNQADTRILLSALHLLGPDGGHTETIHPANIGREVKSIELYGLFSDEFVLETPTVVINIKDTAPLGEYSENGDVVAFELLPNNQFNSLRLASSLPARGEPVWLAAQVLDGAPPNQQLHLGEFLGIDGDGDFIVQFANKKLDLQATSGAPVLNADGEVVAINLGGWTEAGFMIGVGNPVTKFRAALLEAADEKN